MKLILLPVIASIGWSATVDAQSTPGSDVTRQIAACRDVRDDGARLACFDKAATALTNAQRNGDLVVLDRKAVVERRQRAFGLPSANSMAAADVRGAEVKELTSVVRSTAPTRTPGRYSFRLADGSAWEMLDPIDPPRAGTTVTVTATRLGGFRAKLGARRAVLVKRLR
jgi:hypothetical protein